MEAETHYLLTKDYYPIGQRSLYNWEGLYMQLDCNMEDIPINEEEPIVSLSAKKDIIIFIHEYIHFLQNFSTTWGVQIFVDLNAAYLKIAASGIESTEVLAKPLNISKLKNQTLKDGFELRNIAIFKLNQWNSLDYLTNGKLINIEYSISDSNVLNLSNGILKCDVGAKVLKEHMARYATQTFLNLTDKEINVDNKRISIHNETEYYRNYEYWILFEFFYQMNYFANVGKGIFILCNLCFSTALPFQVLARFVLYTIKFINKFKINHKYDMVNFVTSYFEQGDKKDLIKKHTGSVSEHCNKFLSMLDTYKHNNDFLKFSYDIVNYSTKNLKRYNGGAMLFSNNDVFDEFIYWKNKVKDIGSGVIQFKNATQMYGLTDHLERMSENFMFFMSISFVVYGVISDKIIECPFMFKYPICRATFKGSDSCYRNPYDMANMSDEDGKCLFGNGVSLLALDNRIG